MIHATQVSGWTSICMGGKARLSNEVLLVLGILIATSSPVWEIVNSLNFNALDVNKYS